MLNSHLLVLQVVLPLIAAPICVIVRQATITWCIAAGVSFASLIISCLLLMSVGDGSMTYAIGGWAGPWGIEYTLDRLTAFILIIINGIAAVVLLGARQSLASEIASDRLYLFYSAYLLNLTGILGVIMTGDAFNLFVFIEIASLSSYAMISIGRDRRCLYAAFNYLILGTIGASFILISVGLLYALTGTLNMADLYQQLPNVQDTSTLTIALVFFTIGIGLKAAMFPLHLWLPDAYTYSPSIVSTFLAGTSTKVFVYVLIRFIYSIFGSEYSFDQLSLNYLLMMMACGAILYGSIVAIKQDSLKRLLAYSSIAQIGYMILGISIATELGLIAGLAHIFNHAIIKVTLFLSVTLIIYYRNTDSLSQLAGIAKQMPFTMGCFVIAGLSLIGIPATAGFTSKWFLITAAFTAGYNGLVVLIVFSSILAVVYIWKIVEVAYFKTASQDLVEQGTTNKSPRLLYLSLIILVFTNVYFGLETSLNIDLATQVAQDLMK